MSKLQKQIDELSKAFIAHVKDCVTYAGPPKPGFYTELAKKMFWCCKECYSVNDSQFGKCKECKECKGHKKEWPQEDDMYWSVDGDGTVVHYKNCSDFHQRRIARGNCFRTELEAKHYSKRIESLSKGMRPEKEKDYWAWDWKDKAPFKWCAPHGKQEDFLQSSKFPTKEACQAWYDEFGESWEFLYLTK